MFYVYILYSASFDKFYIGQTSDLVKRLERHNDGLEDFTSKYLPWELRGFVQKETRSEAIGLEKKLKNLSKKRIIAFIEKYGSML